MEELYDIAFFVKPDFINLFLNEVLRKPNKIRKLDFDFQRLSNEECCLFFCFEKDDIVTLRKVLQIPEIVKTRKRYIVSG